MPRNGITYNDVKTTALQLLARGESPSVQKIREHLKTGSNSTIAEHLRAWRDEHAKKEVYSLPATLPQELGVAMESIWQTAMVHAEQQMLAEKQRLDAETAALQQEKTQFIKLHEELQSRITHCEQALSERDRFNSELKAKLSQAEAALSHQHQIATAEQERLQQRLERAYVNKEKTVEALNESQQAHSHLQQELKQQSLTHQKRLDEERQRQTSSEARWLMMLDQAKQELKSAQKLLSEEQEARKKESRKHDDKTIALSTELAQIKAQAAVEQKKVTALISELDEYKTKNHDLLKRILEIQSPSKVNSRRPKKPKNKTFESQL